MVFQTRCDFHDVLAGQVIPCQAQDVGHHLRNRIAIGRTAVIRTDFWGVFFDQRFEVIHRLVVVPALIVALFDVHH